MLLNRFEGSTLLLSCLAITAGLFGCGSDGDSGDLPEVKGPASPQLALAASEMRYDPKTIAVTAGEVPVLLRNAGTVVHDLRIDGQPQLFLEASPGQTSGATWALKKGRYAFYCSVTGHRSAGMEGVVEAR